MSDSTDSALSIIHDDLTENVPRKTRPNGNGVKGGFVALILLLLFLISGFQIGKGAVQEIRKRVELRDSGIEITGEVSRKWNEGRSLTPHISYTFKVDGQIIAGESEIPDGLEHSLRESNTLPIRYLPEDPAVNQPAQWEWSALAHWETFLVPIVFFAAPGIAIVLVLQRNRKLVAKGTPTAGVVAKCSAGGRIGFQVKYEFRTKEDIVIAGTGWSEEPREPGAKVCVIYSAEHPNRNQLYPSMYFQAIR